jgi:hypothetical protein
MTENGIIAKNALKRAAAAQRQSGAPSWGNITGKPSEFPPAPHTHSLSSLDTGGYTGEVTIGGVKLTFNKGVLVTVV